MDDPARVGAAKTRLCTVQHTHQKYEWPQLWSCHQFAHEGRALDMVKRSDPIQTHHNDVVVGVSEELKDMRESFRAGANLESVLERS